MPCSPLCHQSNQTRSHLGSLVPWIETTRSSSSSGTSRGCRGWLAGAGVGEQAGSDAVARRGHPLTAGRTSSSGWRHHLGCVTSSSGADSSPVHIHVSRLVFDVVPARSCRGRRSAGWMHNMHQKRSGFLREALQSLPFGTCIANAMASNEQTRCIQCGRTWDLRRRQATGLLKLDGLDTVPKFSCRDKQTRAPWPLHTRTCL